MYFVPWIFRKPTKILVLIISAALFIIGCFSITQLLRGLNANVSLMSGSALFDYFDVLFDYGNAGPPAYVIFNHVNYTDHHNIENMELIDAELSGLKKNVLAPIYSWVGPFKNFVSRGVWSDSCGSEFAMLLPFDQQMKLFIQIEIES